MPNLVKNFNSLNVGKWLCPPLNFTMKLQGLTASNSLKASVLMLKNCTNSTLNGNKCASQE